MKKILLSLCTVFLVASLFAQKQDRSAMDTSKDLEKYTSIFKLNDKQQTQMKKILLRRQSNLSEVLKFKTENPTMYLRKIKSIDTGLNSSIRMMLDKEQMKVYREKQIELRRRRANKEVEMRQRNASKEEIDQVLAEMYILS